MWNILIVIMNLKLAERSRTSTSTLVESNSEEEHDGNVFDRDETTASDAVMDQECCCIASCIGYFELFCALQFTYCAVPALLCYSVNRSTAQWTLYLYCQELSVVNGRFCR